MKVVEFKHRKAIDGSYLRLVSKETFLTFTLEMEPKTHHCDWDWQTDRDLNLIGFMVHTEWK